MHEAIVWSRTQSPPLRSPPRFPPLRANFDSTNWTAGLRGGRCCLAPSYWKDVPPLNLRRIPEGASLQWPGVAQIFGHFPFQGTIFPFQREWPVPPERSLSLRQARCTIIWTCIPATNNYIGAGSHSRGFFKANNSLSGCASEDGSPKVHKLGGGGLFKKKGVMGKKGHIRCVVGCGVWELFLEPRRGPKGNSKGCSSGIGQGIGAAQRRMNHWIIS